MAVSATAYVAAHWIPASARMMTETTALVAHRLRACARDVSELSARMAFHWRPRSNGYHVLPRETVVRWPRAILREVGIDCLATLTPIQALFSPGNQRFLHPLE